MDVKQLLTMRQNKFIEDRTIIAERVNKYLESLANLDNELRAQCIIPTGTNAQEVLPALWQEPFDEAAYQAQLAEFNRSVASVKLVYQRINEEALRCLQAQ